MPLAVFDLDGTLVDQASAARSWAGEFVARWGLPVKASDLVAAALTERVSKQLVFDRIVEEWSLPLSGAEIWAAYRTRMPQLVQCASEDKEALTELRAAGWSVGIATNGMPDNQEGKIRATGLAELIDGWVISGEVGIRKPDPRIFGVLAQRLCCALDGWMVGDSLEHDVMGGMAAGLQTAWIAPLNAPVPAGSARFDIRQTSVAEAVGAILTI
ncbi:HAD family hydrolase [Microbacterium murale]|uniref:HAD superfamily hydrolase (TIGR01549 family) n=1 Tax=Microbacterium murale TaxID=1081040 RepID=A0ABU0PCP8_9MICO|nr:HAD family hydrolase [Microbacterium murale]MDQ0644456.1 HAD superfamily hydrolase (TIGR01549 family) [Microbacterium murale]